MPDTLPDTPDEQPSVLHKHPKSRGFVQVENSTVRDPRLSFRAIGLLTYLMSLPQGAAISSVELAKHRPEGRTAIQAAYRELAEAGYVSRERKQGDDGRWRTTTHVYEVPPPDAGNLHPVPSAGSPTSANLRVRTEYEEIEDDDDPSAVTEAGAARTTSSSSPAAVWHAYAKLAEADQPDISNPGAWRAAVAKTASTERAADLVALRERHPEASPDTLAALLYSPSPAVASAPSPPYHGPVDLGEPVVLDDVRTPAEAAEHLRAARDALKRSGGRGLLDDEST